MVTKMSLNPGNETQPFVIRIGGRICLQAGQEIGRQPVRRGPVDGPGGDGRLEARDHLLGIARHHASRLSTVMLELV